MPNHHEQAQTVQIQAKNLYIAITWPKMDENGRYKGGAAPI
jgi:hypothetical protein